MSAIHILHIVNGNVKLFGMRLFVAAVVLALLVVGALTLRLAIESSDTPSRGNTAQGIIELHRGQEAAAGSTEASADPIRGNMAESIIAAHKRQELAADSKVASEAPSHGNMTEGIIALHKRQELAGEGAAGDAGLAARWAAVNEAYHERYGLLTSEQSNQQKAYWAAVNETYLRQFELTSMDRSNRQKAYWAAVNEAYRKRYGLSGQ